MAELLGDAPPKAPLARLVERERSGQGASVN
jgi:hypothetical protein